MAFDPSAAPSTSFNDWAGGGNFGYFDNGDGAKFGFNPMMKTSDNEGQLPFAIARGASGGNSDPETLAKNQYNSIFNTPQGFQNWGRMGIGFNDSGSAFDPNRTADLNGQQVYRMGQSGQDALSGQKVSAYLKQQGLDPNQVIQRNDDLGYYMQDGDLFNKLMPLRAQDEKALSGGLMNNGAFLMAALAAMAMGGGALAGAAGGAEAGAGGLFSSAYADAAAGTGAFGAGAGAGAGAGLEGAGEFALGGAQDGMLQSLAPNFSMAQTPAFVGPGTTNLGPLAAGGGGFGSVDELLSHLGEGPPTPGTNTFDNATGELIQPGAETPTPDASMKGMLEKLGSGVNPQDIARLGLSNFGDVGNLISRMAFSGPQIGGTGMSISPLSIGQGVYGLFQQDKLKKLTQQLQAQADPQAAFRGSRAAELDALMKDPSLVTKYPGYDAGLQAVERRMASQGFNGSGNMMTGLAKYGGDFFNQAVQTLNGLAGGSPVGAAQLGMQGNVDATQLLGQSLNRIGYGLSGGPNPAMSWQVLSKLMNLGA